MNTIDTELEKIQRFSQDDITTFLLDNNFEHIALEDFNNLCDRLFEPIFNIYDQRLLNLAIVLRDNFFIKGTTVSCEKTRFKLFINQDTIGNPYSTDHNPFKFNNRRPKKDLYNWGIFLDDSTLANLPEQWTQMSLRWDKMSLNEYDKVTCAKIMSGVLLAVMDNTFDCCSYILKVLKDISRHVDLDLNLFFKAFLGETLGTDRNIFPNAHQIFDMQKVNELRETFPTYGVIEYIKQEAVFKTRVVNYLHSSLSDLMTFSGRCNLIIRQWSIFLKEKQDSFIFKRYIIRMIFNEIYPLIDHKIDKEFIRLHRDTIKEKIEALANQHPPCFRPLFNSILDLDNSLYYTRRIPMGVEHSLLFDPYHIILSIRSFFSSQEELAKEALMFVLNKYASKNLGIIWLLDEDFCNYFLVANLDDSLEFFNKVVLDYAESLKIKLRV